MRVLALHGGVIAALVVLGFVLPEYHHGAMARILVLAVFALGYNVLFGYTGLLSLGHAMFFAAGLYGTGLAMQQLGWSAAAALPFGIACGAALGLVVGVLALRTIGVGFMIVTLMFAQAGYLTSLYFTEYTRGDEGFTIPQAARAIGGLDLSNADTRYLVAVALFGVAMLLKLWLVRSPAGRVMVAIRENEERTRMLGFDPFRYKLMALVVSAAFAGAAGAAYGVLFGYVGATFASIQYSILPLLYVLLGGAGTVIGPLIGTVLMFYLVDFTSSLTSAYNLVVGVALVALILVARKGILGTIRDKWARWIP